jgi:hypothetical protein
LAKSIVKNFIIKYIKVAFDCIDYVFLLAGKSAVARLKYLIKEGAF